MKLTRKTAATAALLLSAGLAQAAPGVLNAGGQFSTGGTTTGRALPPAQGNPSLLTLALKPAQGFRMSVLELPSVSQEIGPVDDFTDDLERIEQLLARQYNNQSEAQAAIDEINALLPPMADAAYFKLDLAQPVPLLPMVFRVGPGVMSLHADASASAAIRVLDAPVRSVETQPTNVGAACGGTSTDCELRTDSAVFLRSGVFGRFAIGYGQKLMDLPLGSDGGSLHVGGRVSYLHGRMSKQVARLDNGDANETAFDRAGDNYDLNEETTSGVAVDAGASWVSPSLHFGLTVRNLNAPEFDYGEIGANCSSKPTPGERADCEAALVFVDNGEIEAKGSFKMDPQAMAEAMVTIPDSQLRVLASVDLNAVDTVSGDQYQGLHLGLNYEGPWYLPGVRAGYQTNLAGTKLDAVTAGLTLFGFLNIDALYGLESTSFEGEDYPRTAAVRVGFAVPID